MKLESINQYTAALVERFASRTALVGVIGLGYVGLPLALRFSEAGFRVLGFVINTVEALLPYLRAGQLVSLESTTYPGTTEEELRPRIESRGLKVGEDVFLCFSPEREDPGNGKFTTRTIPKICAGTTPICLEVGVALYSYAVERVVPMSSTRAAEMTKLLENIHRAVNIGLVNELKIIADRMDIA